MPCRALVLSVLLFGLLPPARAQQAPAGADDSKPKIQLSFVNSCRPAPPEVEQMKRALASVSETPRFSSDFEISRGLTTLTGEEERAAGLASGLATGLTGKSESTPSSWVRIRRDFPDNALLTDAQYSLSIEDGSAAESLALHLRDSREALEISISAAATGSASQMVRSDTPPERIRIERFGRSSVVLARCPSIDQSAYEPLFQTADEIFRKYRAAMAVRSVVPAELAHLPALRASGSKGPKASKEPKAAGANH